MTSAVFSVWSGHATTRARAQHRDSFYNHFLELSGGRGLAANLLLGGRLVRWAVGATLKGGNRLDARVVESWARPWSRQRILRGLDHFSPAHLKHLRSKLRSLRVPVLLIWGEQDNIFGRAHALRIMKELFGSRLVTIPNCGHWSPVDAPEEVARLINTRF